LALRGAVERERKCEIAFASVLSHQLRRAVIVTKTSSRDPLLF
jgi:hypothetical protein